jgi:hypothetical protein
MSANDRQIWLAILAKLVAPTEPVAAAKAMQPMLALLAGYPDEAFVPASAQHVAVTGRILPDGKTAPLTRVPTYGELETALGRWWRNRRDVLDAQSAPRAREALSAPPPRPHDGQNPEAVEAVRNVVSAFVADRTFSRPATRPASRSVKPSHASPGHLLAFYEAQRAAGLTGLDGRIEALRQQVTA